MFVLEGCTGLCTFLFKHLYENNQHKTHQLLFVLQSMLLASYLSISKTHYRGTKEGSVWQLLCLPSFILHQCFYLMRLLYNFKHHSFPFFRSLATSLCNRGDGERRRVPSRDTTWKLMLNYCHLTCYLPLSPAQVMRNPL